MSTDYSELNLVISSHLSFSVELWDADGTREDIAGVTVAQIVIKEDPSDSTDVLLRRTADGNLTIDEATATLTATLSQVEADALPAGVYIGEASVTFGTESKVTKFFNVRIRGRITP